MKHNVRRFLYIGKHAHAGFLVAYTADARVYHSYDFTWMQQYRRNYIVGQTLQRYRARFQGVQKYGEGKKLAISVFKTLLKERRIPDYIWLAADCWAIGWVETLKNAKQCHKALR